MDGPFTNLVFSGMRLRNFTADAINFHSGVTNSRVTNSDARNAGDDALAMWSEIDVNSATRSTTTPSQLPDPGQRHRHLRRPRQHRHRQPGRRLRAVARAAASTSAHRFASTPLGRTDVLRNTIIRSGSLDPNWQFGVGALWFDARDAAMTGLINVDDLLIQQSPYEAIQFVSGSTINNVQINNATIQNTGTFVLQAQVGGSARSPTARATGTPGPGGRSTTAGGGFTAHRRRRQLRHLRAVGLRPGRPGLPAVPARDGVRRHGQPERARLRIPGAPARPAPRRPSPSPTPAPRRHRSPRSRRPATSARPTTAAAASPPARPARSTSRFTPTAAGNRTGTLTITAAGVTSTVPLSRHRRRTRPDPLRQPGRPDLRAATVVGSTTADPDGHRHQHRHRRGDRLGRHRERRLQPDQQLRARLAVGASCTVTVTFTPDRVGHPYRHASP